MLPREAYERRCARFTADREREAARSRILSQFRLVAFLLLIGAGILAELRPGAPPLIAAVVFGIVFIVLVFWHQRVRARELWATTMVGLNEDGLRRLDRDWNALAARPAGRPLGDHAYGGDLDLFGTPALAQLLGPTGTPAARATLEHWLLVAAGADVVRARQQAVRELAPLNDLRDEAAVHARRAGEVKDAELRPFLQWAEEPRPADARTGWLWMARLLPIATAALIALDAAGLLPATLWLIPLAMAASLSFGPGRAIRNTFRRLFSREGMFHGYPELMRSITSASYQSPALEELRTQLSAGEVSAAAHMARLQRIMHLADLRYSPMIYLPVQLFTLWDFHVMERLEAWRRAAGRNVRGWFEAAGEFEALSAFAVLTHDHPDWVFAELEADAATFRAEQIGHPMLPGNRRVHNDVEVGPPGTFLLVTGSNMSGKSTLLRAIGMNTVLSLAGGPACAARLRLPDVELYTSIHIEDSLVRGVSFFMAQLQRMKVIVAAADEANSQGKRILYLLDEMLQGTNTAERRIAATRVIGHLLEQGAIGAVTTHDLELAQEPALLAAAHTVHFREDVRTDNGRPVMTFDFKLRSGVATSTNALKLMEIVGLD